MDHFRFLYFIKKIRKPYASHQVRLSVRSSLLFAVMVTHMVVDFFLLTTIIKFIAMMFLVYSELSFEQFYSKKYLPPKVSITGLQQCFKKIVTIIYDIYFILCNTIQKLNKYKTYFFLTVYSYFDTLTILK